MITERPQWPHTVADIEKALDGVWGLVGAVDSQGNLIRLEKSLQEPTHYILLRFAGQNEDQVVQRTQYQSENRQEAVRDFAGLLGFGDN